MISGMAYQPGEVMEHVVCRAAIGTTAKPTRAAYDVHLRAEVATPLLDFSERTLSFHHAYRKGAPIEVLSRSLTLRNISKLPLAFALKCGGAPFFVDHPTVALAAEEAATVNVACDPNFKVGECAAAVLVS